jgi:hypothetical protein
MPLDNNTPNVRNNPMPTPKDDAVIAAHEQAEKDIEQDPELNMKPTPEHDLDEGEIARLGDKEEKNDNFQRK